MDYQEDKQNSSIDADRPNLGGDEALWGDTTPERDPRSIGNAAISRPEQDPFPLESSPQSPELGQIINLEMPPSATLEGVPATSPGSTPEQPSSESSPSTHPLISSVHDQIKSTGKITDHDVKIVKDRILKLNQDGNIADFYEEIRGAA